ncbi:uridylate kinase [Methanocella sp. CWC-04]|uniref:Isopentenyl phosphate kinase n=1 Tax=Methanooceanicella nereidis TaxID=2052831 RepID=A0AAP2RAS5_9EURY|nr:isopentenyl phosphate kinase [Methanocella sp. CWC-04]MCD1293888.1 uridylate kinase [Methanocella sp. CWC-04]
MRDLVVLKVGGSVLTDKNKSSTARPEQIARVAREIHEGLSGGLVLIHGAGSFGHHQAKEYGLKNGLNEKSIKGIWPTHYAVKSLNNMIIEALAKNGVNALPVHPLSACTLKDGRIDSMCTDVIELMLDANVVPVLHGDAVLDREKGIDILSGDQLVVYLARELRAKKVGIGTNVDGVYDVKEFNVIREITPGNIESVRGMLSGSSGVDVTGGMYGKIMELMELANAGIPSQVFNAEKEGNIARFLNGGVCEGTSIRGE